RVAADWPGSDGRIPSSTPSNTTTASNPRVAHFHALWSAGTGGGGATAGAGGASRSRNVTPWLPFGISTRIESSRPALLYYSASLARNRLIWTRTVESRRG